MTTRTDRLHNKYTSPLGGYYKDAFIKKIETRFGEKIEILIPKLMEKHKDKRIHARKLAVGNDLGVCKQTAYDLITVFMDGHKAS